MFAYVNLGTVRLGFIMFCWFILIENIYTNIYDTKKCSEMIPGQFGITQADVLCIADLCINVFNQSKGVF